MRGQVYELEDKRYVAWKIKQHMINYKCDIKKVTFIKR